MKHLLRFHILGTIAAVLVLVTALIALVVFGRAMEARKVRVLEVRDRLASFDQNKRIFSDEAKQFEIIKSRITALEGNIVTEESIPVLLSSLETLAKEEGVDFEITLVDTAVPEATSGRTDQTLRIDFSASGGFANIQALTKKMQSQYYQVLFSQFSLFMTSSGQAQTRRATAPDAKAGQWQLLGRIDVLSF